MTLCRELKYKRLILRNACGSKAVFTGNIFRLDLLSRQAHAPQSQVVHLRQYRGYKVKRRFCAHLYQDKRTPQTHDCYKSGSFAVVKHSIQKQHILMQRAKEKIGVSRKACARTPIFRCRSCFFDGFSVYLFHCVMSVCGGCLTRRVAARLLYIKHPPQCHKSIFTLSYS